jgi:cytochrome c oxidase assembly protein subunit 11
VLDPARNRRLVGRLVLVALGMFGFGYLLVPLYTTICRVAGLSQVRTVDPVGSEIGPQLSRTVLMQFDSNLHEGLPWVFRPIQPAARVHPGELVRVAFEARNESDRTIIGQAIASYAPEGAAAYVRKLQCFCFSLQTLAPHEVRRMPVLFIIDPKLPNDVPALTLSYTFFEVAAVRERPTGGAHDLR